MAMVSAVLEMCIRDRDFFGNVKIQAVSGMLSVLYAVLSFAITQPLANKLGKKEWCCMGAGFAAVVFGILFFFPIHNPVAFRCV